MSTISKREIAEFKGMIVVANSVHRETAPKEEKEVEVDEEVPFEITPETIAVENLGEAASRAFEETSPLLAATILTVSQLHYFLEGIFKSSRLSQFFLDKLYIKALVKDDFVTLKMLKGVAKFLDDKIGSSNEATMGEQQIFKIFLKLETSALNLFTIHFPGTTAKLVKRFSGLLGGETKKLDAFDFLIECKLKMHSESRLRAKINRSSGLVIAAANGVIPKINRTSEITTVNTGDILSQQ